MAVAAAKTWIETFLICSLRNVAQDVAIDGNSL
jgi:hypothetical protein